MYAQLSDVVWVLLWNGRITGTLDGGRNRGLRQCEMKCVDVALVLIEILSAKDVVRICYLCFDKLRPRRCCVYIQIWKFQSI